MILGDHNNLAITIDEKYIQDLQFVDIDYKPEYIPTRTKFMPYHLTVKFIKDFNEDVVLKLNDNDKHTAEMYLEQYKLSITCSVESICIDDDNTCTYVLLIEKMTTIPYQ